jgi:hypothetical protein
MSKRYIGFDGLVLAALLASAVVAAPGGDPVAVTIDGSIGLELALENSCIAVWVPLGKNMAISGVTWYNNDGTIAFPEILVQGGFASQATSLTGALPVATNVVGSSSGWSEVTFAQPVTTDNEGLYVIFRVPAGTSADTEGTGGGPAIGYTRSSTGCTGWMSADGEDWMQIHPSFGLAVLPTVIPAAAGMAAKSNARSSRHAGDPEVAVAEEPTVEAVPAITGLSPASPNPFNPRTTLNFTLTQDEMVDLAIYSIRGELVRQLVSERRGRGAHSVEWDGIDHRGQTVASGVYLARFEAGAINMTQRLVLMR